MKLQPSPPPMGGEGEWYKCKSGGDGKIWLGWPGPASTKQICTTMYHWCLEEHLKTSTSSIYSQFHLVFFVCYKIMFGSWLCFAFPPSSGIPRSVGQVWIDGSGNDFIISPSFADWANCRRILTASQPSSTLESKSKSSNSLRSEEMLGLRV